ncbi:MAG: phosphoribulokinase, partial [Nocardioidaceae bacterium]
MSDKQKKSLRPIMLAIAGDSGTGKTTVTAGLVKALGPERMTSVAADDYHRYDREERKSLPFTPLSPECNYIDIMEQHLEQLARGEPILKPVYDHHTGELRRPEYVEPREFVIVEGLLPLHTKRARACFEVSVFLDPPEALRIAWKLARDTKKRGYTEAEVRADLLKREPESERFIRPQRTHADIVIRFAPIEERGETATDPLSATLLLRPTIDHPELHQILSGDTDQAMHLKLSR